jgi:hypothetical protein
LILEKGTDASSALSFVPKKVKPTVAAAIVIIKKMKKKRILVLYIGNRCRSQIAEGYLQYFAKDKAEVYSAGIEVFEGRLVNPSELFLLHGDTSGLLVIHALQFQSGRW